MNSQHDNTEHMALGMAAAVGAMLMFAVMNAFAKYLSAGHSVIEIAFYRNLVGCLPECFVRPDLGPRLHAVYGSAAPAAAAATCLRQDVSDAVTVLAHVAGAEASGDDEAEVQRAVEEAGCDPLTKRRVKEERAGVVWHIYHAADADKIRDLLNKVGGPWRRCGVGWSWVGIDSGW